MYSQEENRGRRGTRCLICTGCGRCGGVTPGVHVVTGGRLPLPGVDLKNRGNRYLVAADVGTTTIAMQLFGWDGSVLEEYVAVNPQVRYGADVLSRIQAAAEEEKRAQQQRLVMEVLAQGIRRFRNRLSMKHGHSMEHGYSMEQGLPMEEGLPMEGKLPMEPAAEELFGVLAANTVMVYLLTGRDPAELGRAPFHASYLDGGELRIEGVVFHIFPGLSAFVGGDVTAGILASGMAESREPVLLIDLGTNGEMALGSREKIALCSTAAGPAFEGGVNRGVWGADMVSFLARMRREGLLDETGLLAEEYFEGGVTIGNVCVTQQAVRALQLAKGAVFAGIQVLAEQYGTALGEIGRVVLAGGFGYYLDPGDAADIGLLPRSLAGKSVAGGNTALAGCLLAGEALLHGKLQSLREWKEALPERFLVNLAEDPVFQKNYIAAMNFPTL